MSSVGHARSFAEANRFDRVGRIPTPTPFPVGDINTYLLLPAAGGDDLTLIDTGVKSPESFEALRFGFKEFGYSFEQLRRILVTHAHPDHYGQTQRLRDLSGATVYASAPEAERMSSRWLPSAQRDESTLSWFRRWGVPDALMAEQGRWARLLKTLVDPVEVDVVLDDGDAVQLDDLTLEVIATPGHCEGHVVFYHAAQRVLFSGDHLLTDISPVPLLSIPAPGEPRPKSLLRFMDSLERVEALACDVTFPSHGDVIYDHLHFEPTYRALSFRKAAEVGVYEWRRDR